MRDTTHVSDRVLAEARTSLLRHREAGRRRAYVGRRVIGRRAAQMRNEHRLRKLLRIGLALGVVTLAAVIVGLAIDGLGFTGLLLTVFAALVATAIFARWPRMAVPDLATLHTDDPRRVVASAEMWLESQRAALPAPATRLTDRIGVQLDSLEAQLEGIAPGDPAAREVRSLVGEHLPGIIASYRRIPAHLRGTAAEGGSSPDADLTDGLTRISGEIDAMTRRLAEADLDELAVKRRYLDYKYGGAIDDPAGPPQEPR